jgi:SAM-dependent methyltransferase
MVDQEIRSTLKYVSGMRRSFLLSEIREYLSRDMPVEEIYRRVAPWLPDLQLKAIPRDGDYEIARRPPAQALELSSEGCRRIHAILESRRIPPEIETLIEEYIEKKVGKPWDDPVILERLRRAIVAQKGAYWKEGREKGITYQKAYSVLGYLAYHFPVTMTQFQHMLVELAGAGLLKTRMRVLDAGAGPGSVSLATIHILRALGQVEAEIYAIEKFDENREAYEYLVPRFLKGAEGIDVKAPIIADLRSLPSREIPDAIDLLVFSSVLNEMSDLSVDERAALVLSLSEKLVDDGTIVIMEPADLVNSTEMRKMVLRLAEKGLTIHSPCTFLWGATCRPTSCWSFEEKEKIQPTRLMATIARDDEPYRYLNTDIKYSYAVLRKDTRTATGCKIPSRSKFARLSHIKDHVNRRINVIAAVMSRDLGDQSNHLVKLCDGTAVRPVYAVLPEYYRGAENDILLRTRYGGILELRNVLVRYNRTYDAYNLLVNRNTRIYPVPDQRQPGCT